jgi:Predicted transcription factor, homolog of eukaryotic MBF1
MPISREDYTEGEREFINNIGYRIQFFRKRAGLSQAQLAEKIEMSVTTIGRLEGNMLFAPSLVALYRIAQALGVKPEQLLKDD